EYPLSSPIAEKIARLRAQDEDPEATDTQARRRWQECLRRSGRELPYDETEIAAICEDVGIAPADLEQAWVLQRGQAYWILGQRVLPGAEAGQARGWYHGPYAASDVAERAEIALAPADPHGVTCQVPMSRRLARKSASDLVA